jgi:hypothetical protein
MLKSERLPTNYNTIEGLEYISSDDILACELNAALLDLEEIFDILFIEKEHLSQREFQILVSAHKRGRKKSIADATSTLFQRMRDRNGTAACIEYLQNCGKFSIETTGANSASTKGSSGFQFNVFMPEDEVIPKEVTDSK